MKKLIMATAFATILPVCFGAIANQDTNKVQMNKDEICSILHQRMTADAERLNLTTEQKNKMAELVKEHKKELMEDIRDELDDRQKQEFDKMVKEKKAAWSKKE